MLKGKYVKLSITVALSEHESGIDGSSGMELRWSGLCVSIAGNQILNNVSGSVSSGEVLAIMGPSGAGKTTLMNTLNGRTAYHGYITVGGTTLNKTLKRRMCYVLQQECFFANLTLKQTVEFTAMIRLPDEMSKSEKMSRLQSVVDALDLNKCLHTNMGGMFSPGLSGGEKKRASIACELIRDPDIIFLDEPTTGLDSSTAFNLMSLLKKYAVESRKTVIASIHQPSTLTFYMFDKLNLILDGQVVYFGETTKVVDHFEALGVSIDENYNPADFILEVLSETEVSQKLLSQQHQVDIAETESIHSNDEQALSEIECNSLDPGSVRMSLLDLEDRTDDLDRRWPTGFLTQYKQLTLRTFLESRKRILDKTKLLENLLICGAVSLIFFQLPRTEDSLRDRMGAVFFIAAHWGFIPLYDAVTSFPMERMVINKERAAGWYRLSAYYLAKMTSELPLILVQPLVFVVIAYWVIGLNGIEAFFATLGTVLLVSIAGQSFGLFIGIACTQINQAMTVTNTFQMAVMLLGGLFTRNIPIWLDWMKYLSFLHYSFHCLMVLEFHDAEPVECVKPSNRSSFTICQDSSTIPSQQVLHYYNVTWSYWQYVIFLLAFTLVFRILGYITLRYFRKPLS